MLKLVLCVLAGECQRAKPGDGLWVHKSGNINAANQNTLLPIGRRAGKNNISCDSDGWCCLLQRADRYSTLQSGEPSSKRCSPRTFLQGLRSLLPYASRGTFCIKTNGFIKRVCLFFIWVWTAEVTLKTSKGCFVTWWSDTKVRLQIPGFSRVPQIALHVSYIHMKENKD